MPNKKSAKSNNKGKELKANLVKITVNQPKDKPSFEDVIRCMQKTKEVFEEYEPRETKIIHVVKDMKPLFVRFVGDLHIGARGVNYNSFLYLIEFFRKYPFAKMINLGDINDNFIRFPSLRGANDSVAPPSVQLDLTREWLEELHENNQILSITLGNHGVNRDERAVGYSVFKKMLSASLRKRVFEGIGELNINFYKNKKIIDSFRGIVAHTFRGSSIYNQIHGGQRAARESGYPDFVGYGHHHSLANGTFIEAKKKILVIKCGTLKTKCAYSERYYHNSGSEGAPVVIFVPESHEMVYFENSENAILFYKALMKKYK